MNLINQKQFNEVFSEATQNERNIVRLSEYKMRRTASLFLRMAEAERIIKERMDGAPLYLVDEAITRANRVLLYSTATAQTAAIRGIGDWPGPEAA